MDWCALLLLREKGCRLPAAAAADQPHSKHRETRPLTRSKEIYCLRRNFFSCSFSLPLTVLFSLSHCPVFLPQNSTYIRSLARSLLHIAQQEQGSERREEELRTCSVTVSVTTCVCVNSSLEA